MIRGLRAGVCLVMCGLGACTSPRPTETLVQLETPAGTVSAVSTESGILTLVDVVASEAELEFRYHIGRGRFDDKAQRLASDDVLALYAPVSSQPNLARFCGWPASNDERLFLEIQGDDGPELLRVHLLENGELGDFLTLDSSHSIEEFAGRYTGCGVWVYRNGFLQLAGVLNGLWLQSPLALAFVGIDRISHVLPQTASYFDRSVRPYRADFEYGIPRDFEGEIVHSSGTEPIPGYATDPAPRPVRTDQAPEIDVESLLAPPPTSGDGVTPKR